MINDDQTYHSVNGDNVSALVSPPNTTGHDPAIAERTTDDNSEETQPNTSSSVGAGDNYDRVHIDLSKSNDKVPGESRSGGFEEEEQNGATEGGGL